jgi:fermentation-respiration switch protein FrsA (DUF1100 family)
MRMRTLAVILAFLVAVKLLVIWLEPRLAFYPIAGVQATPAAVSLPFEDLRIHTVDGETLHGWWLEHPQPRAQVIFWHGNGGNLSLWMDVVVELRRRGFSVLAVDYRGYGLSSGRPSERGIYRDAEAAVREFDRRFRRPGAPVVYWGRSIGAPVAASTIGVSRPDALVLESPMPNARAVIRNNPVLLFFSLFSSYTFATSRFVQGYDGPLLVVHGDQDGIVPYSAGQQVFRDAGAAKRVFVTIPGADHNDLHVVRPDLYWQGIDQFFSTLRAARE